MRLDTVEMWWQLPQVRSNFGWLAERRKIVQYDNRGYGLSEREVTDFSLEVRLGDLTAVLDSLEAPAIDLLAQVLSGPTAISYTATHPDRIRRLCLSDSVARGRDLIRTPRQRALRHLIEVDWELYVQTQVLVTVGWTAARSVAEGVLGGVTAEVFVAASRAALQDDVQKLLPKVRCPTLVVQQRSEQVVSIGTSRQLAAAIPNARLTLVDQNNSGTILGDEAGMRMIEAFLDEEDEAKPSAASLETADRPSGTAIILFADIVDSTALTERLGDAAFREKARALDEAMRAAIRANGGTAIEGKTLGDGVLAVFTSARQAITCAQACHDAAGDAGLALHAGIHAGDVIRESDNVYGGAVNIAARVAAASAPGETLVSATVRDLARTSAGVSFEDRGEQALKGIEDAVRLFAVR